MSLGYSVGDFIAISQLAIKVYTAYKDVPDIYGYIIADEVAELQVLIDRVEQQFKSATISNNERRDGQKVLEGCQSVLEDLIFLVEMYKIQASTNKRLVFKRVKLGMEDIAALRVKAQNLCNDRSCFFFSLSFLVLFSVSD